MKSKTLTKKARLARITVPTHVKDNIATAASIQGTSEMEFAASVLDSTAVKIITDSDSAVLKLGPRDQALVAKMLDESDIPHPPVKDMVRLRNAVPEYIKRVRRK